MCVYQEDAFQERVNFAANYIANRRTPTRRFDPCFEMYDGDVVVTALVRRADADPAGRLASNLSEYFREDKIREKAQHFAGVPTKRLKHEAAKIRAKAKREFETWLTSRN